MLAPGFFFFFKCNIQTVNFPVGGCLLREVGPSLPLEELPWLRAMMVVTMQPDPAPGKRTFDLLVLGQFSML